MTICRFQLFLFPTAKFTNFRVYFTLLTANITDDEINMQNIHVKRQTFLHGRLARHNTHAHNSRIMNSFFESIISLVQAIQWFVYRITIGVPIVSFIVGCVANSFRILQFYLFIFVCFRCLRGLCECSEWWRSRACRIVQTEKKKKKSESFVLSVCTIAGKLK